MSEQLVQRTLAYAETLAPIPNAPYLHGPMLAQIMALLRELGVRPQATGADPAGGLYAQDDYCLYVRFKRGEATTPLLIDSHLDHPAFVLDGQGGAFAMGSVGYDRLNRLLADTGPIPLRVFGPDGKFLTQGRLTSLDVFKATVDTDIPVPANSHGLFDVTDFAVQDERLLMHAADNMIVTDLMLALIEDVVRRPAHYPDLDVTFIFSFLEEVFEASATAVAMRGTTPFAAITEASVVIVLEAMEPVPLLVDRTHFEGKNLREQRLSDDSQAVTARTEGLDLDERLHPLYQSLSLPLPADDAGVAIKVNDFDNVYGYEFPDQPNLAESLLLYAAQAGGVTYQHTLFGGACNGIAFSLFPTTSHIVTLSLPNPYKHNLREDGAIIPEEIRLRDLRAAAAMMAHVLTSPQIRQKPLHPDCLSVTFKQSNLIPSPIVTRALRAERGSIAWSTRWRLRRARYFGRDGTEMMLFKLRGAAAQLRERLFRRIG